MLPPFGPLPGGPSVGLLFLVYLAVPSTMAVVYQDARENAEEQRYAWTTGAFLAGLGGPFGFGSVVVGLLYYTVGR